MHKVTVEIPDGDFCLGEESGKLCVFARYTKKWGAYNCARHHRLLKGEKFPRKCQSCVEESLSKDGENSGAAKREEN